MALLIGPGNGARGVRRIVQLGSLLALLLISATAAAKQAWEEYDKLIDKHKAIATLGPQLFGDNVDLYTGALSFSTTDVSLPGNNALPVAVTRTFSQSNSGYNAGTGASWGSDNEFADWQIDIPNISGLSFFSNNSCDSLEPPDRFATGGGSGAFVGGNLYWKGDSAHMPGGGELLAIDASTPLPSAASPYGPYKWITQGRALFSCLPSTQNIPSAQGFYAVTSDGTKYWFKFIKSYSVDDYVYVWVDAPGSTDSAILHRTRDVLYATRVEDRFGNWVAYNFDNATGRLTSIQSNDGRQITLTYNAAGYVSTVSDGTHIWNYQYASGSLTGVTQPDTGQWSINFAALSSAQIKNVDTTPTEPDGHSCTQLGRLDTTASGTAVGTITHPSGAVGTFTIDPHRHGRTQVPEICGGYTPHPGVNEDADDFAILPFLWRDYSITSKTISGSSLATQTWNFTFGYGSSYALPVGGTEPYCQTTTCLDPLCQSDACVDGYAVATIVGPSSTDWKKYKFGNTYRYNEGKLLQIDEGTDANNILRTTTKTYEFAQSGKPYPVKIGTSQQTAGDGFTAEYPRPGVGSAVTVQGVTFSNTVDSGCAVANVYCLDNFLRPTRAIRSSTLGYTATDSTTYFDQLSSWVLGQVATSTTNAIETSRTSYDSTSALPLSAYSFGILQNTLSYNADGTLATVKDGLNHTISLSTWVRGVPTSINYPTSVSESAGVNNDGSISSTTDELGYTSSYGYDAMGRLNNITYPTGDTTNWNATGRTFAPVASAEYGIPAGHWKLTEQTGSSATGYGKATTFFDAQWRPVLVLTEDTNNAASKSFVVKRYDTNGRVVFSSYPVPSLTSINDTLNGASTTYDALGRATQVQQNSELGLLTNTNEYLTGFQIRTTNPRGYQTTTSYQVFDAPDTSRPMVIQAPEGQATTFTRDVFGAPLTVTRTGPGN